MRPLVSLLFVVCTTLAATAPAGAQVYRWVDDRGVVNYATKPPADGRAVMRIDLQESRISVIPAARSPRPPLPSTAQVPTASPSFPGLVDRTTVGALAANPDWRERCIAERRVDCDSPTAATFDVVPSLAQTGPPYGSWIAR